MNLCTEIKQNINCVEYARRIGLSIQRQGDRCVSPLRPEARNRNSFVVYDDFWYDFGSNLGGDVVDLCAEYAHESDKRAAIRELSQLTGVTDVENCGNWMKHTQNACNLIEKWHGALRDCDREYLHGRRITDDTIENLKIGYTDKGIKYYSEKREQPITGFAKHRISVPYFKNGYVAMWIARAIELNQEPKYLKPEADQFYDHGTVWGMHTLNKNSEILVIAEGTFDAMSFYQEKYSVIATMGGHFSHEQLPTVRDICQRFKQVFICFDNDDAGSGFTVKFAKYLFQNRISFIVGQVPAQYKDVSEYYADGGDLQSLIADAQDGITMLALKLNNESEFKKFVFQAARHIGKPELAKLFSCVRDKFDTEWLAEVRRVCFTTPAEDVIARDVTQKHNLKYLSNVGFYEYQRGAWRFKTDEELQAYISEELGFYRTGARLSSVLKLIKSDTITTEPFDKKALFNFINGTLELATGIFRKHDAEDLLTIQANYPYNPQATHKKWDFFVEQICNFSAKRMSLLQEMTGYILFPTCELERIFILMGDGSNGKSKFLNIITEVFGIQNKSSVTVAGLCADFQRINLSKSLFNVSTEVKANLAGSEEYLKQIASGETISACFKGKNFIDFNPRCKMIFACNGQVKSKDTSNGLARRMCMVDFQCKFVDYPQKPNEYQIDVNIQSKLMGELSGIFNWAYDGYKLLKSTMNFTVTDDEETLKSEFVEASNPLITFLRDFQDECTDIERISYSELYEEYKSWCIRTGHQPGSQSFLTRNINKIKPDNYKAVDTKISGAKFKGYVIEKITLT